MQAEKCYSLDSGRFARALVVVRPELLNIAQARWQKAKVIEVKSET